MTHSSPSRRARVRIARGSEPASGSDSANAASHSPLARRGSTRALSSSEPARRIGSEPRSWTASSSDEEAHALATSSIATHSMSAPVPVPPWASSNGSPNRSWSANSRRTSSGNSPLASIAAARGATRAATISRMTSRNAR